MLSKEYVENKDNISPFEFIPWILGQCSNILEVKEYLSKINLINTNFSNDLPLSPLHWIISDKNESITVESVKDLVNNNMQVDTKVLNKALKEILLLTEEEESLYYELFK